MEYIKRGMISMKYNELVKLEGNKIGMLLGEDAWNQGISPNELAKKLKEAAKELERAEQKQNVIQIVGAYLEGESTAKIGEKYGRSQATIRKILSDTKKETYTFIDKHGKYSGPIQNMPRWFLAECIWRHESPHEQERGIRMKKMAGGENQ